jgi:hypothetical protein
MLGIVVGVGEGWRERAEWAACRMNGMTGIPCVVAYETRPGMHPSWGKLWLPEKYCEDSYMIFDADMLPMKRWNPEKIFKESGRRFMACRDVNSQAVHNESKSFCIPIDRYLNCGLMIFGGEHFPVLEEARKRVPSYGSWLEQTAVNRALIDLGVKVQELPRAYNTLLWPQTDKYDRESLLEKNAVNLHAASLGGRWDILKQIQDQL